MTRVMVVCSGCWGPIVNQCEYGDPSGDCECNGCQTPLCDWCLLIPGESRHTSPEDLCYSCRAHLEGHDECLLCGATQ